MRQFIRHPLDVPIEIRTDSRLPAGAFHTQDISLGGLAVHSDVPVEPAFEARARVAWCRPHRGGAGHEVGVSFLDPEDVFRARMVAQICYIEDYRRSIARAEGRDLSSEEAAGEWIAKYAHKFPGASGGLQ
jgi:hypothetical protein